MTARICSPCDSVFEGASDIPERTILCVDDEVSGLRVRRMLLESSGYRVLIAGSGKEGVDTFSAQPVDAVLLDYYMPGMSGGEVAAEMKRRKPQVPVILLSAYITVPERTLEMVDAFITKGQPPDFLLTKLDALLRRAHSHPEMAGDYLMFVNHERRYVEVTDAVCRLLGYRRAEILGMTIEDVAMPAPTEVRQLFQEYRAAGQQRGEFVLRHKTGKPVPVRYEAVVLADGCLASRLTPMQDMAAD